MRSLFALAVSLILGLAPLLLEPPPPAQAQAGDECEFVLGFATLQSMIPEEVGQCLTNVQYDPATGDGLQHTTAWHGQGGLMVWRKADNWTAFTDGHRTWINGPFGLQQRFNSQRFTWEQNPERLPLVPAPVAGERCHTGMLSLRQGDVDAAAGNRVGSFIFTNESNVACTFNGFPGVQMLDSNNNPLPTNAVWGGGLMANEPGPSLVTVAPGGTAVFKMHWGVVEVGDEPECPTATRLAVIPPDERSPLVADVNITACDMGTLNVSAVQPGP